MYFLRTIREIMEKGDVEEQLANNPVFKHLGQESRSVIVRIARDPRYVFLYYFNAF